MTKFLAEFPKLMRNLVVEHWQLGCGAKTGGVKMSLYILQSQPFKGQRCELDFAIHI